MSISIYYAKSNDFLYILCVALSFLCEGGHFSCFPAACVKIFGIQNGGQIFTIMFFAIPISSLTSFFIVEFGKDSIDPQTIFVCASVLTVINMIQLYFFDDREMKRWTKLNLT